MKLTNAGHVTVYNLSAISGSTISGSYELLGTTTIEGTQHVVIADVLIHIATKAEFKKALTAKDYQKIKNLIS